MSAIQETIEALRSHAEFCLEEGLCEEALAALELIQDMLPEDPNPSLVAVAALLRLGSSDRARAWVERLRARLPDDPRVAVAQGEILLAEVALGELSATIEPLLVLEEHAHAASRQARSWAQDLAERASILTQA